MKINLSPGTQKVYDLLSALSTPVAPGVREVEVKVSVLLSVFSPGQIVVALTEIAEKDSDNPSFQIELLTNRPEEEDGETDKLGRHCVWEGSPNVEDTDCGTPILFWEGLHHCGGPGSDNTHTEIPMVPVDVLRVQFPVI